MGVFVWALTPFCVGVFLLFVSLFPLAKRKSGWGICGSSLLVWLLFLCFASIDLLISRTLCPCTNVFAAYSHIRTEPLARHRPNSRKKKSLVAGYYTPKRSHLKIVVLPQCEAFIADFAGRRNICALRHRG